MTYQIITSSRFSKDFKRLDRGVQEKVRELAYLLRDKPYIGRSLKGGLEGRYSLRIGDYRIIYLVDEGEKVVHLVTVRHRRRVYRS